MKDFFILNKNQMKSIDTKPPIKLHANLVNKSRNGVVFLRNKEAFKSSKLIMLHLYMHDSIKLICNPNRKKTYRSFMQL